MSIDRDSWYQARAQNVMRARNHGSWSDSQITRTADLVRITAGNEFVDVPVDPTLSDREALDRALTTLEAVCFRELSRVDQR